VTVREPRARVIVRTAGANGAGIQTLPLGEVIAALEELSRSAEYLGGWVSTGAVADAIGVTVGVAAARLRVGRRQGLCAIRRSLRDGTSWKLTDAGARLVDRPAPLKPGGASELGSKTTAFSTGSRKDRRRG
jgi:hypothetical protein